MRSITYPRKERARSRETTRPPRLEETDAVRRTGAAPRCHFWQHRSRVMREIGECRMLAEVQQTFRPEPRDIVQAPQHLVVVHIC